MTVTNSSTNSSVASRRNITGQGIILAAGTCEIDFPPTSTGKYDTGAVTVYNGPSIAQWMVTVNGQVIDVLSGAATSSTVQIGPNDVLILTSTGLQAYSGQTVNATFAAVETDADNTDLVVPGHDSFLPNASTLRLVVGGTKFTTTGASVESQVLVPLQPTDRSLIVFAVETSNTNVTTEITVIGQQSGLDYSAISVLTTGNLLYNPFQEGGAEVPIPVYGLIDSSVLVTFGSSTVAGVNQEYWICADSTERLLRTPTVTVSNNYLALEEFTANFNYSIIQVNQATNTSGVILAAPAANTLWEIAFMEAWVGAGNTTGTGQCYIGGTSTGFAYVACPIETGSVGQANSGGAKYTIAEGLTAHNGPLGNTASFTVIYRSVPNTYDVG